MQRIIFHIDVNSAFLSWSAADRIKKGIYPDLREIPSVIGGNKKERKGIVLAASIPAKQLGIKTGEKLYNAMEKCENLITIKPDFAIYSEYSRKMKEICERFSPTVEMFSIDELFLDYTNMEMHFGSPLSGAAKIQEAIFKEQGVTVNIGISENKLLAKMASDFEKPNKIHTLFQSEIKSKMWPLPISDLLMIGRKTSAKLESLGIKTIYQLAEADDDLLEFHFKSQGKIMKAYANGIDLSNVKNFKEKEKSISNGTTLFKNADSPHDAYPILLSLCEKITYRLRNNGFSCNHLTLYLKDKNFVTRSECMSFSHPVSSTNDLFNFSKILINRLFDNIPIRAITLAVSKFSDMDTRQCNFFDDSYDEKAEAVEKSVYEIRKTHGYLAVTRASLLNNITAISLAKESVPRLSSKL